MDKQFLTEESLEDFLLLQSKTTLEVTVFEDVAVAASCGTASTNIAGSSTH
jgi:hypothetical protein